MRVQELKDYAINTGKFYNQHCEMAREGATHRVWELHVRANILLDYRREFREPYEGLSTAELSTVATELQRYYINHLDESDAQ
jgi:hypothetical protein